MTTTPAHVHDDDTTVTDPRPELTRALDQIGALVATTGPDQLDRPTPCEGWDVRTLLGHVVAVHRMLAHAAEGGSPFDIPHVVEVPDDGYADAVAEGRAAVGRTWSLDGDSDEILDRELVLAWGTMPGRIAGFGYAGELTVHAWDLAVATGRVSELDPSLAADAMKSARSLIPAEQRGGLVPFGPVVDVAADAGPYEQLVGWLGRHPTEVA